MGTQQHIAAGPEIDDVTGKRPTQDTALRYVTMVQLMPVGRWLSVAEIRSRLADAGYEVTERTVQRDLWKLSRGFCLEAMDVSGCSNKYVWRATRPLAQIGLHATAASNDESRLVRAIGIQGDDDGAYIETAAAANH